MQLDFNQPVTWLLAFALLVLLVVQGWFILRNRSLSPGRKTVRALLNGLLWLAILGYILPINWPIDRPTTHVLLVGEDVPAAYARTVQDSLHLRGRFTTRTLKTTYDSVTLVGQDFPTETLTRLSQSIVRWVPYDQPDQVQELRWKGVVRQGEMQHVTGQLQSSVRQLLRIQYGTKTLDSLMLAKGRNTFDLHFPTFGRGRAQTELVLGGKTLDTVRFYSRPTRALQVRFVLDNPDFESKTLADWLGKQGHSVQLSTTLATNVRSSVGINSSPKQAAQKPDVVITDPANATNTLVRKAIAEGKAVLFINLSNPLVDGAAINRALGTRWQVRKLVNQETVPVGANLTAHPYRFAPAPNQFGVPGYPVAVQQVAGRVGLSLLNETYPLSLSGDSTTYSRIWYATLARLQPTEPNNVLVDAPVYSNSPTMVYVNNPAVSSTTFRVGRDTVSLTTSPLNRQSAVGMLRTQQSGWQPVQDSLRVWVEHTTAKNPVAARQTISRFMLVHARYQPIRSITPRQTHESVPNWGWLTVFLVCLTALWVEPKIA